MIDFDHVCPNRNFTYFKGKKEVEEVVEPMRVCEMEKPIHPVTTHCQPKWCKPYTFRGVHIPLHSKGVELASFVVLTYLTLFGTRIDTHMGVG